MYRRSHIVFFVLGIILFVQSCHSPIYLNEVIFEGRVANLWRIPAGSTIFTDSISCTISLTDSVLYLNERPDRREPELLVVLKNLSSSDLRLPLYRCYISPYESISSGIDIQIHKVDEEPHLVQFLAKADIQDLDSNFAILTAGDSAELPFTVNMSYACELAQSCTDTGTFVIRVLYKNVLFIESTPPFWVGERWSNSVQFDVEYEAD